MVFVLVLMNFMGVTRSTVSTLASVRGFVVGRHFIMIIPEQVLLKVWGVFLVELQTG